MNYSLNKIAKELGLSKATVSLVLSGKARKNRISEEVEKRVKAFCAEVNYVPNIHGGIVLAAENIGCRVSVQLYTDDMDESRVFDWLRNHEIDGLIYYGLDMPEEWKKTFLEEGRHVVGIGTEPDENILGVNTDNFEA